MNNISYKNWQAIICLPATILTAYYQIQNGRLFNSQAEAVAELLCQIAKKHQEEIIGQLADDMLKEIPDQLSDMRIRNVVYLMSLFSDSIAKARDALCNEAFSVFTKQIADMITVTHNAAPIYAKIAYHVFNHQRSTLKRQMFAAINFG
jgi:hypothetical protein